MVVAEFGELHPRVLKAIDAEGKKIVADAAEFARTSPEPDPSELYTDVYVEAWGPYTGTTEPEIIRDAGSSKGEG